jgi:catechol 2,3-dioxygenase-like lactoylglutathione lyase family enzyme
MLKQSSAVAVFAITSLLGGAQIPIRLQSNTSVPIATAYGGQLERQNMVRGIDNIGISASDLARSVSFYETLGFSEAYRNDRGVMLAAGTVQLFLFATRRPAASPVGRELGLFSNPPGIDHISLAVSDVDALYGRLRQAGITFGGLPEDQPWGARMVGLKDPDGNNLYLLQRLQKPAPDSVHRH